MSLDDKKPRVTSSGFFLKDVLQGDILNTLPHTVDAAAIEAVMRDARPRLAAGAIWTCSCTHAERVTPEGRAALRNAIGEFRRAGGLKVVVSAARPAVQEAFRSAAKGYVTVDLVFTGTFDEALAVAKAYREARDKKPT